MVSTRSYKYYQYIYSIHSSLCAPEFTSSIKFALVTDPHPPPPIDARLPLIEFTSLTDLSSSFIFKKHYLAQGQGAANV